MHSWALIKWSVVCGISYSPAPEQKATAAPLHLAAVRFKEDHLFSLQPLEALPSLLINEFPVFHQKTKTKKQTQKRT